jgi:hypothetical protein
MNKAVWNKYQITGLDGSYANEERACAIMETYDLINKYSLPITYLHRTVRIMDYLMTTDYMCINYTECMFYVLSIVDMYFSHNQVGNAQWLELLKDNFGGYPTQKDLSSNRLEICAKIGFDVFHYTYFDCVLDLIAEMDEKVRNSGEIMELLHFYCLYLLSNSDLPLYDIDEVAHMIVGVAIEDKSIIAEHFNREIADYLVKIDPDYYADDFQCANLSQNLAFLRGLPLSTFEEVRLLEGDEKPKFVPKLLLKFGREEMVFGKKLGEGVFGTVCLMTHVKTLKKVAVKCFNEMFTQGDFTAMRELVALVKNESSNIIKPLGYMTNKLHQFSIVMELADKSLESQIKSLDKKLAHHYIVEIMEGIRCLHSRGFVHRDLKPANLLIRDDRVLLGDLGLSAQVDQFALCDQGDYEICTLNYRSLEATCFQHLGSKAADIWSLGCIIYELLTGDIMFPVTPVDCYENGEYVANGLIKSHLRRVLTLFGTDVDDGKRSFIEDLGVKLSEIKRSFSKLNKIKKLLSPNRMRLFLRMFDYNVKTRITIEELIQGWYEPVLSPAYLHSIDLDSASFARLSNLVDLCFV